MQRAAILIATVSIILVAAPAAAQSDSFGWEDGTSTTLGKYDSGNLTLVNSDDQAHSGTRSLEMTEDPTDGTPQAYIWWVTGLEEGDQVTASFYVYDDSSSGYPSGRIWGHWTTDPLDVTSYGGSASGNGTYTSGIGWEQLSYTWTFDSDSGNNDGMVVEARIYASVAGDTIFVDDAAISVTSSGSPVIHAPDGSTVPVELQSFSVE